MRHGRFLVFLLLSACAQTGERPLATSMEHSRLQVLPPAPRPPSCSEESSAGIVRVRCRAFDTSPAYTAKLFDQVHRIVAKSTLATGKTYFSSLGSTLLAVQTTQPICREEAERDWAAWLPHATPHTTQRTECQAGGSLQWLDREESFELLTDDEAVVRSQSMVPIQRRPLLARLVLATKKAQLPASSGDEIDPFDEFDPFE
jgi:hypothetical protein